MLSKPQQGWTEFRVEDQIYRLSCLTDLPMDWLDRAIFGLESGQEFTVRAQLEPGEFRCTVSKNGCVVNDVWLDFGMDQFCRALHRDLSACPEAWAAFGHHGPVPERRQELQRKRKRLEALLR